ncbi:hypothetical protein D0N36_09130 [Hymenobacter lapidiphilus]|uniref:hypothetical protein n=1 Tax=Hymenobacter sp. CCM 8763 TaxID=2303334 RepID=UPI000E346B34|nr:hypothetical protein [Hymenobacter sp. CCM 8763]RFP65422.1 hypothetical protein D0N36_09130 [Hymenobacter sp. CCM 8763]
MLQATLAVLDQHAALYATNKALGKAHDELAALVAALDPTADRQRNAATPAQPGAVKKQTKQLLARRAAEVAAALLALADERDDITLHTDADYTEKQLLRQPDADLLRISSNLHARATEHAKPLAQQDVTPQELTDLSAAISTFQQELTTPRTTIATGKALKQQMSADLRQANNLLRSRIDKYLLRYQRPQTAFYSAYQSARQTINTAARSPKSPAI